MAGTDERRGTLEGIALSLAGLLGPLVKRLEDGGSARALLAELGLQLPPAVDSVPAFKDNIKNIAAAVKAFRPIIEDLIPAIEAEDIVKIAAKAVELAVKIAQTVDGFTKLADGIKTLSGSSGIPLADLNAFAANLPQKLLDYLLVTNMETLPFVVEGLELVGIVTRKIQNPGSVNPAKPEFLERTFDLNKLTSFLQSPKTQFEQM